MEIILRRASLLFVLALILVHVGCGSTGTKNTPPPPGITVGIVPAAANVRAGAMQPFTATVAGTTNKSVTWSVNGIVSGNATMGTISSNGVSTAPATVPNPNAITIGVVSAVAASATATSDVTLWNVTPVVSSVSPTSFAAGAYALTVTGSKFVSGAQVMFGGSALTTTYISSTQLTARGSEPTAGTYAVSVSNPNPGSSTSGSIHVTVTSSSGGNPPPSACSAISLGQGGSLNGFLPFPADNAWNQNVADAPVDPNSAAIIRFIGASDPLHPDFGSGEYNGSSIGIPYIVVDSQQTPVAINFTAYGDESDPGPMPVPANAPIEGYPDPGSGDRHVLVVDNSTCWLYELYSSYPQTEGSWNAASAAVWDLLADANQVILKALQQYGMIMADNGSNMYISGAPDDRWNNDDLHNLDEVTASDFEVVEMSPIYTQSNLPTGAAPVISGFTASANNVTAGTQVTLSWNAVGASYYDVTPQIGAIRGTSVVVTPSQTTTYTLHAANGFGRTTATVTVTVP
jgi:hypothetical protein